MKKLLLTLGKIILFPFKAIFSFAEAILYCFIFLLALLFTQTK